MDDRLMGFLADLEQQAATAFARERDVEVADRARAEYGRVTLASRLMACHEQLLTLQVAGVGQLAGNLVRVGDGWLLLSAATGDWLVPLAAVTGVRGLTERSVPEEAWPVTARLGLGSALRGLAEQGRVQARLTSGDTMTCHLERVGADFVEARLGESGGTTALPFSALAAVRSD